MEGEYEDRSNWYRKRVKNKNNEIDSMVSMSVFFHDQPSKEYNSTDLKLYINEKEDQTLVYYWNSELEAIRNILKSPLFLNKTIDVDTSIENILYLEIESNEYKNESFPSFKLRNSVSDWFGLIALEAFRKIYLTKVK